MITIPVNDNTGKSSTVCEHFGHAPYFAFIKTEGKNIEEINFLKNPFEDHAPGQIPSFLNDNGTKVIIARGMGGRAKDFFKNFGIDVVTGATGSIEEIMNLYLNSDLVSKDYTPEDKLHHHGEGHDCNH